jgi:hypothetical protein
VHGIFSLEGKFVGGAGLPAHDLRTYSLTNVGCVCQPFVASGMALGAVTLGQWFSNPLCANNGASVVQQDEGSAVQVERIISGSSAASNS